MAKTKIEWADETWNPIVGCSKISEGCQNCYAEKMAARLATMPQTKDVYDRVIFTLQMSQIVIGNSEDFAKAAKKLETVKKWNGKTALNEKALEKKFTGSGKRIFVCSMGDLFHESVFFTDIDKVIKVIKAHPQHIFMFLTKRPEKMKAYFNALKSTWPDIIPNLWIGVTAENQEQADRRVPVLLQIPAAKRFVSVEPMLGPVDLMPEIQNDWLNDQVKCDGSGRVDRPGLDWVICGGESGRNARPLHPEWVRSLQKQCKSANVPFFFKQWGEWGLNAPTGKNGKWDYSNCHTLANDGTLYKSTDLAYPDGPRRGEALRNNHDRANLHTVFKIGKKKAGKMLDGKEYIEVPK